MWRNFKLVYDIKSRHKPSVFLAIQSDFVCRMCHNIPFVQLYMKTIGKSISSNQLKNLKKKHPNIDKLSYEQLKCTLQILKKFNISTEDACNDPHVFTMNPITMDNYGEILKECGFIHIIPMYIIRYHTLVKSRTIEWLKKENLMRKDLDLEELLFNCFQDWAKHEKSLTGFSDTDTNIVTVRMSVLQKYLHWKIGVTAEEFSKYCRNYLVFKHRPMHDIQEALDIALNEIKFDVAGIRRNGFLLSSDPVNTKLILENVQSLASLDIREVIRIEPAILKNNYNALLEIKAILQEFEITDLAQHKCFKIYCMSPDTVRERLNELRDLKEYQILNSNPRVLSMVVHKRKMINRLEKIQAASKQCYSLNHLISSSQVFNNYISSFGSKVCGMDLATLISSSLRLTSADGETKPPEVKQILQRLKRHKFCLHVALNVINDNIQLLKKTFSDDVIFNNCHLLLYPAAEIENYLKSILKIRSGKTTDIPLNTAYYYNLNYNILNDDQILSLVLYQLEKSYHFSGDGIWTKQDGVRADARSS